MRKPKSPCPACGLQANAYCRNNDTNTVYRQCQNGHTWRVCGGEWFPHTRGTRQSKIDYRSQYRRDKLIDLFRAGACLTVREATAALGLDETKQRYMRELIDSGKVYVADWKEVGPAHRPKWMPAYKLGKFKDVPKPIRKQKSCAERYGSELAYKIRKARENPEMSKLVIAGKTVWERGIGINKQAAMAACSI